MKRYNLLVAGGGISGVAAAVSAAREGLAVLLVENTGCLGGSMSGSLVYPFMKYSMPKSGKLLSAGIFTEMRNRHKEYGDASFESYKLVFDDMVTEAGVDVLFHSTVCEAITEGRKVKAVRVATKAGIFAFDADFFVDTTGDGELLYLAGCDYQLGREEDSLCQPMTTCFRLSGVDYEIYAQDRNMIQRKYKEYREAKKITNPRENILVFFGPGEGNLHFNTTRVILHNPVDPFEISRAEIIARKQVGEMLFFLKSVSKAFRKCTLVTLGNHIGVRESRKLKGVHILHENELAACIDFPDTIALGNYEIDIHNPSGTGTEIVSIPEGKYYQIPYRSLLPKEYDNLLVAGRCLSATHRAHAAVRILPICACLGEAAGVAVAIAQHTGSTVHSINIPTLQSKLQEKGAAI